ncbi:MAG: GntR family transcriptional regulator, partial [Spirochaetaceae bacterium]|nr:GntR family transcriptional regulator [Spirochaetaceae bacterium]
MKRLESTVIAEEVYLRLKRLIVDGELPPGGRIDRRSLAQELGVSPTPLNDALARLLGERFVERRSGRREEEGLFVPERPEGELVNIFAVRAGLEGMAARLAVERVRAGADPAPLRTLAARFRGLEPPFDAEKTRRYLEEDKL